MGEIVAAMATSHAFALIDPDRWDDVRNHNRKRYTELTGNPPPVQSGLERETPEANKIRYERIRAAHDSIRQMFNEVQPTTCIVIGDDQNENLQAANMPQLAIYVGDDFTTAKNPVEGRFKSNKTLARAVLETGVARGFDLGSLGSFQANKLVSHAHVQVLNAFVGDAPIETVLVFVNAIHHPATEPSRCYAFGKLIGDAIRERPDNERVVLCGSGGLSHFTAGYPWKVYKGPFTYGDISEEFDHKILGKLERGEGRKLSELTSQELMYHGDVEFRSWIVTLGALGERARADFTVYEPFYRGIMGMGVAAWRGPNFGADV